jgi:hypothetical protein
MALFSCSFRNINHSTKSSVIPLAPNLEIVRTVGIVSYNILVSSCTLLYELPGLDTTQPHWSG